MADGNNEESLLDVDIEEAVKQQLENLDKTPEELEQAELANAEQNHGADPMVAAANLYGLYMPKFKQGIKSLSSRGRARLLKALIEYPLNEQEYKHSSQLEKELMAIGHAVLEAKFLMILHTYNESDAIAEALDPTVELTEEQKQEIIEEQVSNS